MQREFGCAAVRLRPAVVVVMKYEGKAHEYIYIVMHESRANLLDYDLRIACSRTNVEMHWLITDLFKYVLRVDKSRFFHWSRLEDDGFSRYSEFQRYVNSEDTRVSWTTAEETPEKTDKSSILVVALRQKANHDFIQISFLQAVTSPTRALPSRSYLVSFPFYVDATQAKLSAEETGPEYIYCSAILLHHSVSC